MIFEESGTMNVHRGHIREVCEMCILLVSKSQYLGIHVLEMVVTPPFLLVVITALCVWELSDGSWLVTRKLSFYTLDRVSV